jgi:hypothetical protein
MVRLPGPMSRGEFREALHDARIGRFRSANGANDATQEALDAVGMAGPKPPRALIAAARAAYRNQRAAER